MENCLIFTIDHQHFAIDLQWVKNVIPSAAVTSMPHSQANFLGIVQVGKSHIPVLNMRAHLEIANKELDIQDQFIICKGKEEQLALWIDKVTEVYKCQNQNFSNVPSHLQKDDLFQALFNHYDQTILVLNQNHLFSLCMPK